MKWHVFQVPVSTIQIFWGLVSKRGHIISNIKVEVLSRMQQSISYIIFNNILFRYTLKQISVKSPLNLLQVHYNYLSLLFSINSHRYFTQRNILLNKYRIFHCVAQFLYMIKYSL